MKKFMFLYFGGAKPTTPEENKPIMDAWTAYYGKLGDKIVDGGAPFMPGMKVGGGATSDSTGYTIISATDMNEAMALTEGHPHLTSGGTLEVYEFMPMPGMDMM